MSSKIIIAVLLVVGVLVVGAVYFYKSQNQKVESTASNKFSLKIIGYGVEVSPRLPVGVVHLENGNLIFGPMKYPAPGSSERVKNVLIEPGSAPEGTLKKSQFNDEVFQYASSKAGTTRLLLGVGMNDFSEVLEDFKTTSDKSPAWKISTDSHEIKWPAGLTLRSDGNQDFQKGGPYELSLSAARVSDNLINLLGPVKQNQVPSPEQFTASGQNISKQGDLKVAGSSIHWIEFSNTRDGVEWKRRYYYLNSHPEKSFLMQVQCQSSFEQQMFKAADDIASSFHLN